MSIRKLIIEIDSLDYLKVCLRSLMPMILKNQKKIAVKILDQGNDVKDSSLPIALVAGYDPYLCGGGAWKVFEARRYSAVESVIDHIEESIRFLPKTFSGYRIETCKDDLEKIMISFIYTSNHSGK